MPKILEKIKNIFSFKFLWRPKKKEEPKLQQEEPKVEEKPKEQ